MGKKKLLKIEKIEDRTIRMITSNKRKKGILKKAIELSKLCDHKVMLYVYDENSKKVTHFSSDPDFDISQIFDQKMHREFYSNMDYEKLKGTVLKDDESALPSDHYKEALKNYEPIVQFLSHESIQKIIATDEVCAFTAYPDSHSQNTTIGALRNRNCYNKLL